MGESETSGINVDPAELNRLAASLRQELDGNLRREVNGIKAEFAGTPGFGLGTASEPLRASHDKYALCLHTASAALDYYVDATEALISAITLAADLYQVADRDTLIQRVGSTAEQTYAATLNQLQHQRHVTAIRDAHISVPPAEEAA